MSLRLFAALPCPGYWAERVTRLQNAEADTLKGVGWRKPDQFHITLGFFGEMQRPDAEALDVELDRVRVAPFPLRLAGAGFFGKSEPHTLWLGVEGGSPLRDLAHQIERAARRAGLNPDTRPYTPHLTIAYTRGLSAGVAMAFVERHNLFASGEEIADRFHLYSSWPTKSGSRYMDEAEYPLMG